jgi:hypothetical protein
VLIRRTRYLLVNGIDLNDPTNLCNLAVDQVAEAVRDAAVESCCNGSASLGLLAELARRLAEADR